MTTNVPNQAQQQETDEPTMWRGAALSGLLHLGVVVAAIAATVSLWPALTVEIGETAEEAKSPSVAQPSATVAPSSDLEPYPSLQQAARQTPATQPEAKPAAIGDTGFAATVVYVDVIERTPASSGTTADTEHSAKSETASATATDNENAEVTKERPVSRNIVAAVPPAHASAVRLVRELLPRFDREDAPRTIDSSKQAEAALNDTLSRYRAAAADGKRFALYNLALATLHGRGTAPAADEAAGLMREAALDGHVPAMLRLAELNLAGVGVAHDPVRAAAWYRVAGAEGSRPALQAAAILDTQLSVEDRGAARKTAIQLRSKLPLSRRRDWQTLDKAFLAAVERGDSRLIEELLDQGADANVADGEGRTSLITAAWRGHRRVAELLMAAGVDPDSADDEGNTALMWASINGYPELVQSLGGRAANIDTRDAQGLTPLMRAAWNGHDETVRTLLKAGARPAHRDAEGKTALDRALQGQNPAIAAALRQAASAN